MVSRVAGVFAFSTLALIIAACSGGNGESTDDTSSTQGVSETSPAPNHVHVMKMHGGSTIHPDDAPGPSGAKLKDYGGPVLSNVKVYIVYWGSGVQFQSHLEAFYPAITDSGYFDWLSEYNTGSQTIGRGSYGGAVTDSNPPGGNSVTDDQIQSEIEKLIDNGKLPANDGNNLYMVYFPPGVSITGPGGSGSSCVEFCAYHGTFTHNGSNGYYGVMPDLGGACASCCGNNAPQDNITEVSSHELIEAVTDGAVGLATTYGPPLAWYDQTNGEIGDICVGNAGQVTGDDGVAYTVQLEWSNKLNLCTALGGGSGKGDGGTTDGGKGDGGKGDGGTTDGGKGDGGTTDGGGGTCSHNICKTGSKLKKTCDSCVTSICAQDAYCCSTKWDSVCVGEVKSICGETCN